jgi:damage-control phosphatase, subfamily I
MLIKSQCLSCIIDDIIDALSLLNASDTDIDDIITESMEYLAENYKKKEPASYYITELHRIIKKRLDIAMPFAGLRDICLSACVKIAGNVSKEASKLSGIDKMRFLIRWTIAANTLDFRSAGAGYDFAADRIEKILRECFDKGLQIDDCEDIFRLVSGVRNIVYIPDNVGELPFDKMLISELGSCGAKVTIPFRSGPITSDVVMADANAVKMHEVANVILSGPDTLGISFKEMTEECRTALENADVIITKGQANFYVLSEFGMEFPNATIISLFVTKCDLVSDIFGLKGKVGIAAILKEKKGKKQL